MQTETDQEIVKENLHAMQAIYFAYQLEQMRVFQVVERIAELFRQGLLPLGMGAAADALLRYALPGERLSEHERRNLYARVLGAPAGEPGGGVEPNREFLSLWMRFVVAVSMCARQRDAATLLRPPTPANAGVRRAARELATNLSLYGAGMAAMAARLAADVQAVLKLLGDRDIQAAYGARDRWQVVDQVSSTYLGGAPNAARYRAQAEAGRVVFEWLAANAATLRWPSAQPDGGGPDNAGLVEAAEAWLAASGIADADVEGEAMPPEGEPCWPQAIDLPAFAQDLLGTLDNADDADGARATAPDDLLAVLHGARGTGKTLAAHVLAQALAVDLFRVDLAQLVSKYIGETEKNLDALFERAQRAGGILFFDEADALFGRRTDVKDAHDRYANLDLAALLQRIAAYPGLVIVATNLPQDLDAAFVDDEWRQRRVRAVPFPRPRR